MKKEACMAAITVCSNNQSLNFQADNKSHILVRACGAMLSVFLTSVIQVENEHPIIFLPVAEALVTCIGVIVLSLFATTPKMPVMEPDLLKNGNQWPHAELIRDIHQQSVVLGRRYKYLRLSYLVFVFGVGITVITSIVILGLIIHHF